MPKKVKLHTQQDIEMYQMKCWRYAYLNLLNLDKINTLTLPHFNGGGEAGGGVGVAGDEVDSSEHRSIIIWIWLFCWNTNGFD